MKTLLYMLAAAGACIVTAAQSSTVTFATGPYYDGSQTTAAAYQTQVIQSLTLPGANSAIVPLFDNLSNQTVFGGSVTALAYGYTVRFTVSDSQAGTWAVRIGGDFGWGGAVFLDGAPIAVNSTDMWWDNQYVNGQSFQISDLPVAAGIHTLQVYGLENCCDGGAQAQFSTSNGASPYVTFGANDGLGDGLRFAVPIDDMEEIGPFPSWANAKTTYGAVGDGVADDTAALQRALNDLGTPGKANVLYLPAGEYRITSTLHLNGDAQTTATGGAGQFRGVGIVGEDPILTTIQWDGPNGGAMLIQNGGVGYRFSRIKWDGGSIKHPGNVAGYGVAHLWSRNKPEKKYQPVYGGSFDHTDEIFQNIEIGIMAGRRGAYYGDGDSEGHIRRVTFNNNSKAGLNTGSFNALDWWIWDSHFTNCARGVSDVFTIEDRPDPTDSTKTIPTEGVDGVISAIDGAGNFHVYRSLFEGSTVADINIHNTQWFSLHNNTSIGSRRFFQADDVGRNRAPVIMQNNRVLDTTDPISISDDNLGPLMMIDNQIRSSAGAVAPIVRMNGFVNGRDVVSVGNRFTVSNPILVVPKTTFNGDDRVRSISDTTVSRSSISSTLPDLPPTPTRTARQVYEVPAGANDATLQAVIDTAAQSSAVNSIVHLPPGTYNISKTIVVPPLARLQITGDGFTSTLLWTGTAPGGVVFELQGPSYATVRDLHMLSYSTDDSTKPIAFKITNADQPGGRVLIEKSDPGSLTASSLLQTQVALVANPYIQSAPFDTGMILNNVKSLFSMSSGNIGRVQSTDSNVLISDAWYEGNESALLRVASGNFTYMGGHLAPGDPNHGAYTPPLSNPLVLDGFNGQATFLGINFDLQSTSVGSRSAIQIGTETPATNALFVGVNSAPNLFTRTSSGGNVGLLAGGLLGLVGSYTNGPAPNDGLTSDGFITQSLQQARSLTWDTQPYSAPAGSTDVRIFRVKANQNMSGTVITGN